MVVRTAPALSMRGLGPLEVGGIDDDVLHELDVIHGSDLQVVDPSTLVNGP